jgi:hypothetical protein
VLWNVSTRALLMSAAATTVVGLAVVAWKFSFFFVPYSWTSEPSRLAQALRLQAGMRVTDIGAGSGAMAIAMATLVGNSGVVYATELAPDRLAEIENRSRRAGLPNIQVIEAAETEPGFPTVAAMPHTCVLCFTTSLTRRHSPRMWRGRSDQAGAWRSSTSLQGRCGSTGPIMGCHQPPSNVRSSQPACGW